MNKDRILALATFIEQQPHERDWCAPSGFGMGAVLHTCGTPSCIAGWAGWEAQGRPDTVKGDAEGDGQEYLGIDGTTANDLFYPKRLNYLDITPAQAASVMRELAETGEVNWGPVYDAQHA
jgi:hypothetical protein